jgi:hypothetical protein
MPFSSERRPGRGIGWGLQFAALLPLLAGCGAADAPPAAALPDMLFVDTKTGEAIVAPAATDFPAQNPKTGARTLMPGLYCPECRAWHATPPIEQLNRQAGSATCPKTGALLTPHGPWPGDAQFETKEAAP